MMGCMGEFCVFRRDIAAFLLQGIGESALVGRNHFKGKELKRVVLTCDLASTDSLSVLRAAYLSLDSSDGIRSQMIDRICFAKDYDAVLTVRTETGERASHSNTIAVPSTISTTDTFASSLSRETYGKYVALPSSIMTCWQFVSELLQGCPWHVFLRLVEGLAQPPSGYAGFL